MMEKVPCDVIRDLLPSYVDGLTSKTTNCIVEKHIVACTDCKHAVESMRGELSSQISCADKKEIDFLKKTRRRKIGAAVGCALAVTVVLVAALIVKVYFIGSAIDAEFVSCHITVDGSRLSVDSWARDENLDVPFVQVEEQDGVVNLSFRSVQKSWFHRTGYRDNFEAKQEITRVCADNRIIWENGKEISAMTAECLETRHLYVGAMPENAETAAALRVSEVLGAFTNKLETTSAPYGWTLVLKNDIPSSQQDLKELYMQSYAYVFLASIVNLSAVTFEYTVDGKPCTLRVTEEEASEFAGKNIKECGTEAYLLQELMEKTVLVAG